MQAEIFVVLIMIFIPMYVIHVYGLPVELEITIGETDETDDDGRDGDGINDDTVNTLTLGKPLEIMINRGESTSIEVIPPIDSCEELDIDDLRIDDLTIDDLPSGLSKRNNTVTYTDIDENIRKVEFKISKKWECAG